MQNEMFLKQGVQRDQKGRLNLRLPNMSCQRYWASYVKGILNYITINTKEVGTDSNSALIKAKFSQKE